MIDAVCGHKAAHGDQRALFRRSAGRLGAPRKPVGLDPDGSNSVTAGEI